MKDKLQKFFVESITTVDDGYGGSLTVIMADTDDIAELAQDLEPLINQEVEKRIAERMPSEEEIDDKSIKMFDSAAFRAGIKWLCSRLSQKTDNLKENNNNGSTN